MRLARRKLSGALAVQAKVRHHASNRGHLWRSVVRAYRYEILSDWRGPDHPVVVRSGFGPRLLASSDHHASIRSVYATLPDLPEMSFWRGLLRHGDRFVDVGANVGLYTLFAAELGALVTAVEPDHVAAERLRANIALNDMGGRVTVVEAAAGAIDGEVHFSQGLDEMNRLTEGAALDGASTIVPMVRLDSLLPAERIRGCKIDVEGAERLVIEGLASHLKAGLVDVLQLEWNQMARESLGETRARLAHLLTSHRYVLTRPDSNGCLWLCDGAEEGADVVAVHESVARIENGQLTVAETAPSPPSADKLPFSVAFVGHKPVAGAHDGFAARHQHLIRALGTSHRVVQIDPPIVPPRTRTDTRLRSLLAAPRYVRSGPTRTAEEDLFERTLREKRVDVVIAPVYQGFHSTRSVTRVAPTVLLLEEDVLRTPEHRELSLLVRVRAALTRAIERSWSQPPAVAVVISDREQSWAHLLVPRSLVTTVPLYVDLDYWSADVDVPRATIDVLCVGAMHVRRNAEGLAAVVDAMVALGEDAPIVDMVSSTTPHQLLEPAISDGRIRFLGAVDDVRPLYRAASCCLVPSFMSPGTKTTVLQAWATGCPVVTTTDAARTVGRGDGRGVLSAATPTGIVREIGRVLADPALGRSIAGSAREQLALHHSSAVVERSWDAALHAAVARGMLQRQPIRDAGRTFILSLWQVARGLSPSTAPA